MDVAKQHGQAERVLSHEEAKAFYDQFGPKQDLQRIYEDPAIEVLLEYASFQTACAVVELGCGTGRLAARLLEELLPEDSKYLGLDISETMIDLAHGRVAPWGDRARVQRTHGSPTLPVRRFHRGSFAALGAQCTRSAQGSLVDAGLSTSRNSSAVTGRSFTAKSSARSVSAPRYWSRGSSPVEAIVMDPMTRVAVRSSDAAAV